MRRLEDRIRDLCAQVVSIDDPDQLRRALDELRAALQEHTQRLRQNVAQYPRSRERRSTEPEKKR